MPTRRKLLRLGVIAPIANTLATPSNPAAPSVTPDCNERISLNGTWSFRLDPQNSGESQGWHQPGEPADGWRIVSVPHTWQIEPEHADYMGVGLYAPHVCQGIDKKCEVMADNEAQHAREQKAAEDLAAGPTDQQRQAEIHGQRQRHIMAVLPAHQPVTLQISHAAEIGLPARVIAQHPADVREPEAAARAVWIEFYVIDIAMMNAVGGAPDQRAVLQGHGAEEQIQHLQYRMGVVGGMREQTVVATGDRHAVGAKE